MSLLEDDGELREGVLVEARWLGQEDYWYPGLLGQFNRTQGKWVVYFADGQRDSAVDVKHARRLRTLEKGDPLEAKWDNGAWYPARVTKVPRQPPAELEIDAVLHDVVFSDDGTTREDVPAGELRLLPLAADSQVSIHLPVSLSPLAPVPVPVHSFSEGQSVLIWHLCRLCDGKVMRALRLQPSEAPWAYLVHYAGWSSAWDEVLLPLRLLPRTTVSLAIQSRFPPLDKSQWVRSE